LDPGNLPPGAVEGLTDFGRPGYGGPCPPSGTHNYYFKLFALDTKLMLGPTANREEFNEAIAGHVLGESQLIGKFGHTTN
jgi:Raf kinase inhibitor-like YbhB/YbcL family protein